MKLPRWSSFILLLLLTSCLNLASSFAQQPGAGAPQKMHVCITKDCEDAEWVGDHYEGHQNGVVSNRYWLVTWQPDHVELKIRSAKAADGVFPIDGTMTGKIAPNGTSIIGGTFDWRIGVSQSGTLPFTITWTKTIATGGNASPGKPAAQVANQAEVGDISVYSPARPSTKHPNIMLPPGASEKFAEFPDNVRAILQPEYGLTIQESKFHCPVEVDHDADADTALEIARFNYRAGDMLTGHCWLGVAMRKGSTRARVIRAVGLQTGWFGQKDEAKAFSIYKELLPTRDPWAIWFLHECYSDGIGTAKDSHQAAILDSWIMTHEEGMNVVRTLGTDDSDQMREKARWETLLNPPMKSGTHCTQEYVTAGGVKVPGRCDTQSVIDNDALKQRLHQIDQE